MRLPFFALPVAAIVTFVMISSDKAVSALSMRSDEIALHTATGLKEATTNARQGLSLLQTAEIAEMDIMGDLELAQDQTSHYKEIPDAVLTSAQTIGVSNESTLESDENLNLAQQEFQWYGSG